MEEKDLNKSNKVDSFARFIKLIVKGWMKLGYQIFGG
jgi:hypothetical protein